MPRKKSQETIVGELQSRLQEAKMELACARVMYEEGLTRGVSEKALSKAEEVIREWREELSTIQNEISATVS